MQDMDVETLDFESMKVAELRTECEKCQLDSKGVKAVLVKRLTEHVKIRISSSSSSSSNQGAVISKASSAASASAPLAAAAAADSAEDFASMKVADLRAECEKRGIDGKGVKAVLVKRLAELVAGAAGGAKPGKRDASAIGSESVQQSPKKSKVESSLAAKSQHIASQEEPTVDFTSLKVADLRKECETRGLDSKGTKDVLVARLEEAGKQARNAGSAPAAAASTNSKPAADKEAKRALIREMKVTELREECEKLGLESKGAKSVLIERLESAM